MLAFFRLSWGHGLEKLTRHHCTSRCIEWEIYIFLGSQEHDYRQRSICFFVLFSHLHAYLSEGVLSRFITLRIKGGLVLFPFLFGRKTWSDEERNMSWQKGWSKAIFRILHTFVFLFFGDFGFFRGGRTEGT